MDEHRVDAGRSEREAHVEMQDHDRLHRVRVERRYGVNIRRCRHRAQRIGFTAARHTEDERSLPQRWKLKRAVCLEERDVGLLWRRWVSTLRSRLWRWRHGQLLSEIADFYGVGGDDRECDGVRREEHERIEHGGVRIETFLSLHLCYNFAAGELNMHSPLSRDRTSS